MRETGPFLGATELSKVWRCGKKSSCQLGQVVVLVLRGDTEATPQTLYYSTDCEEAIPRRM